jgi:hypothetical protein
MAWFKRKPDLISDRAKALNSEIAQLEARIKHLSEHLEKRPSSSAALHAASEPAPGASAAAPRTHEPIFEEIRPVTEHLEAISTPAHYNELGVRKYDLAAFLNRIKNHFRGPSTTNPKLVSYLAAGGIQGLRPLRYERRIARNRFMVFVVFLFLMLLGIVLAFFKQ